MALRPDQPAHPETRVVHTGVYQDHQYRSVTTPIYTTSTFAFEDLNTPPKFDYTRSGNPTREALQDNLCSLEGGLAAFSTVTGMAAIHTVLMTLNSGDHVITGHEVYGGTHRLLSQVLPRMGIAVSFVDLTEPEQIENAVLSNTRLIWFETPTNPLLNIIDMEAVVAVARRHGLLTAIDNTFLTPLLQRPFDFGVDIVVHSTTKYLNGHSDALGGAIIVKDEALAKSVGFLVNALGTGSAPFDSWLVLRGVKTLSLRLAAAQNNAIRLAEWLSTHPRVRRVFYPGLVDHPGHQLASRQQRGFGGMLSFEVDDGVVDVAAFFKALSLFNLCVSLGGVESLIEQPWTMSHLAMPEAARRAAGITPGLIRLSAGIENNDDLIADLDQAFGIASRH